MRDKIERKKIKRQVNKDKFSKSLKSQLKKKYEDVDEKEIEKRKKIINLLTVAGILLFLVIAFWAYKNGYFKDKTKLSNLLLRLGPAGPIIFILLQIVQVVIPIIPGGISNLIGVLVFGPLMGFIYNYIGIVIGSIINFFLARFYGQSFVRAFVKEKTYNKYIGWLNQGKKFDIFFTLAIFSPIAPDDFLCMLAGLTNMSFRKFLIIILVGKPPTLFIYTFFLKEAMEFFQRIMIK